MPTGSILTTIGQTKLNSATPLDQLTVTHVAVGDGNGGFPVLNPSMTALVNEVWRGASSTPIRDPDNSNTVIFEAIIPTNVGGFYVREIGLFDVDGDLIAIGHTAEIEKPDPASLSVGVSLTARIFIALDNSEQINLIYQDGGVVDHGGLSNRNPTGQAHTAEAIGYAGTNVKQHLDDLASAGSLKLVGGETASSIASLRGDLSESGGADLIGFTAGGSSPAEQTVGEKLKQHVSVKDYGATGSGDESSAFTQAVMAANARGEKIVRIPFPTFQVADGTNGHGCTIIGAQTVLTGRISNHSGLVNVIVNGANQSDKQMSPQLPAADQEPKILWRQAPTIDTVIQRKASRGYMLASFIINSTTASESLATNSTNPNRRRLSRVQDAVWAGVYKYTPSVTSGSGWTTPSISAGTVFANMIPSNNLGLPIKRHSNSNVGSYIEYQVKPKGGHVNIAILASPSSCETATVQINGGPAIALSTIAGVLNTIKIFVVQTPEFADDDIITVRLTHAGTQDKALGVIGVQFFELKDWNGSEYDSYAYYRNSASYSEYLEQPSSNDAVIQEYNSRIYGVAYHGGETDIVHNWYVDNILTDPAIGGFVVGKKIELKTSANVSWASVGGGSVNVKTEWSFGLGSIGHIGIFKGTNLDVREVYAHMFGTMEAFSEIIYPSYINLSAQPDDSRNNVGRTNKIVLRNPTTGQTYTGELTLYEREQNRYGGVHVWKKAGQYHKVYYGPVLGGLKRLDNFTCSSVHRFE